MGMIPYDVRSTVSRYSSCSEHSTTIHAFRSATNEGVSSRPMNDIRVLNLKQTKMTYFPKHRVLQKKYRFEEAICRIFIESIYSGRQASDFLSRCKFGPLTSRQPIIVFEFYLLLIVILTDVLTLCPTGARIKIIKILI